MNTTKFLCKYFSEDNEHLRVTVASIIKTLTLCVVIVSMALLLIVYLSSSIYCLKDMSVFQDDGFNIYAMFGLLGFGGWILIILFGTVFIWEWMKKKTIVTCPKDKE